MPLFLISFHATIMLAFVFTSALLRYVVMLLKLFVAFYIAACWRMFSLISSSIISDTYIFCHAASSSMLARRAKSYMRLPGAMPTHRKCARIDPCLSCHVRREDEGVGKREGE